MILFDTKLYEESNNVETIVPTITYGEYLHHVIKFNGFRTDILSHYKINSDKLVVFFNGAINTKKMASPVFQRWSWLKELPYSSLIIADPTIYKMEKELEDDSMIGWYQGSTERFVIKDIVKLIEAIKNKLNINSENIIFYGSSAGGFASLAAASMLKGSKACVVNPQIDITQYHDFFLKKLLKHLNIEERDIKKNRTLNVIDIFLDQNHIPKIFYKQNKLDKLHYHKHYLYLLKNTKGVHTELIEDERGHSAIPKLDEAKKDIARTFEIFSETLNKKEHYSFINKDMTLVKGNIMKSIENKYRQKINYKLNLSENPIGCPLLVVLHGHGSEATSFQYDGWNILAPYDNFAYNNKGSWWLGENGDFFVKDLLQQLIKNIAKQYQCQENIYFYGSSMGGYGAILHGILCEARAVYANVPQIQFGSSQYFKVFYKNKEAIFGINNTSKEENLLNYLNKTDDFPMFFLCENMIEIKKHLIGYLGENTLRFASECYKNQIKLHLELLPYEGHMKNIGLKEVIKKFEKFIPMEEAHNFSIEDIFLFKKEQWFFNIPKLLYKKDFKDDGLVLTTNNKKDEVSYLISGNSSLTKMGSNQSKYKLLDCKKINISINISKLENCNISIFVLEFNNKRKTSGKQYCMKVGNTNIEHTINNATKYLKLAIRILPLSDGISSCTLQNIRLNTI